MKLSKTTRFNLKVIGLVALGFGFLVLSLLDALHDHIVWETFDFSVGVCLLLYGMMKLGWGR